MIEEPIFFLLKELLKTSQIYSDQNSVYTLLKSNINKLNLNSAELLRRFSKSFFSKEPLSKSQLLAKNIRHFGTLIGQFPQGNIANNLEISIACFEVIEVIFNRESFPIEWATSKLNLGNAYGYRIYGDTSENFENARLAYEDALKIYSVQEFPIEWAEIQTNLVILYTKISKTIKKGTYIHENLEKLDLNYNSALTIFKQNNLLEKWAILKNAMASAYCDIPNDHGQRNWELAINIYHEILESINQKTLPELWANTQMNLGIAYNKRLQGYKEDNLKLAVQAFENSLNFYTRENHPFVYSILQNNLGNVFRDQGLVERAIHFYKLALAIHTHEVYPIKAKMAARNLGNTAFKSRLWTEAIEGYSIAIEAVETSRIWIKSEARRQEILEESIEIYQNIVQAYINTKQIDKAFEYSERSRSQRLVDLMASSHLSQSENIPPKVQELLQKYEELQQQIDIERQNYKSENNRSETRAIWQVYNEKIASLENTKQDIWEQLRKEDPILAGEIQVKPLSLLEIQQLIDHPKTAILSFYTTNSDTHIFIITQNSIYLHTCIGEGLARFQNWIARNWLSNYIYNSQQWENDMEHFLHELAERLQLSKIIYQYLQDIEELIIEPHLLLHQIPFAALPTGEYQEYLVDRFLIRYTPSCQILDFCHQNHKKKRLNLDVQYFQYGTVEDATDDLYCAKWEGEQIAQMYNIPSEKRLIGSSQATVQNYRKLAEQVQILHSCHHAESCLYNPLESQLKLGDGSITLGQLMSPGWRLPNLLDVFLSCCETNLDKPDITDNLLTLSTGFLCAGAISVISSLWKVNDLATALFSIFYYQQRQEGKNRPAALKAAQIKLRELRKADLEEISQAAENQRKQARNQKKQYPQDSKEYLECDFQHKKSLKILNTIDHIQKSKGEFPFAHPRYWSAFIAQGLQ
ncbi:CHAT domain-containing tetratricopeptide repeat protein [Dolichospermum sp. UHCC 0684]|jgi:CHAT domain-containing protein|uniref:CHAT domain-containing protein n=1 Tax=unclassified Dolichospermum TaxID=2622029 RepID=UPI001447894B|nr:MULTISPECIES: CHAT domain-containing tetratricopeptide repeat protein [unclassified Dolichospermum]MEA5529200.1 CHAT domain-containing tetratricopeptide repeat protein [Dolichospermum sp. UHCC 0684]MTJ33637.1 CHAT domain-containing protein [Dolichospermum sp. UHCC 0260]